MGGFQYARSGAAVVLGALAACCAPVARAQDARAEQARLAEETRLHPADYETAFRYVMVSAELRDYEAAIGALERLLAFNPNLSRARKELGLLYARLGAGETAALHLRAALESGALGPAQRAQIESVLGEALKESEPSRWSARLQAGLRSQSNGSFFPNNGLFVAGGAGIVSPLQRRADFNAFELVDVANDTDLDTQSGAQLETRVKGYATQQFHLPGYNVGVFGLSVGPRLALDPVAAPGVGVKPYVTGMTSYVGGSNYLNSGGAGVSVAAPLREDVVVEPGVEIRYLSVASTGLFPSAAALGTGGAVTASLAGLWAPRENIRLETRAAFTRANAARLSQSFDQVEGQALLRFDFDSPLAGAGKWSLAPFGRVFHSSYDAADPLLDPARARRDTGWAAGVLVEAPLTRFVGVTAAFEYARYDSNLPNFRTDNLSVWFGPVARF
ncbi:MULTISPECIES: tetratricopeptide repeat protein [Methylosinus]|uniref:Uncharacterized protein n=1 Tax=Methylosinus trichosporium (strain ATCC 35070 / NCIMB 11131 / UNIQEM 75 / OB3b) TaxID=595536 RepID=A0A2D2CXF6_METT3|nr:MULTISPECIES: tetratricopeptide repeat protein [Methylosinus]ATQ67441.1 hypothetical protein CQW49_05680 [Methylosinus trichosporium OB3b]OBS50897.1 hypothetical protein A8B73_19245 [Methylosinus sp. 3S-1]